MEAALYIIAKTIDVLLSAVSIAMLIRAFLPLIMREKTEESRLYLFVLVVTEPFVLPFRLLLYKLNIGQNIPIDLSFTVAYIALMLIRLFLPAI